MPKSIHSPVLRALLELLIKRREAAGLTQKQLADRVGKKHQSFVSKYESGERRLDVIEFVTICRALGLRPDRVIRKIEDHL